jgi:hypothetical protein
MNFHETVKKLIAVFEMIMADTKYIGYPEVQACDDSIENGCLVTTSIRSNQCPSISFTAEEMDLDYDELLEVKRKEWAQETHSLFSYSENKVRWRNWLDAAPNA